jgi:tetratricopeptide (TPR) repeat protein
MRRLLSKELTELARTLPPSDDVTLLARDVEIDVLISDGKFESAETLARCHHADIRALYGDEHPHALVAAGVVSMTLMYKFDAAAQIQHEVLEAERRAGRMDEARSLMCAYATTLSYQGKYNDAERLLDDALERATRVYGTDSEKAVGIIGASALNLYRMEKFAQAADMHRRVLVVQTRVLGTEHPTTVNTQMSLADALFEAGSHDEALGIMRGTLAIKTRLVTHHASAFGEAELADAERAKRARGVDLGAEHAEAGGH